MLKVSVKKDERGIISSVGTCRSVHGSDCRVNQEKGYTLYRERGRSGNLTCDVLVSKASQGGYTTFTLCTISGLTMASINISVN